MHAKYLRFGVVLRVFEVLFEFKCLLVAHSYIISNSLPKWFVLLNNLISLNRNSHK